MSRKEFLKSNMIVQSDIKMTGWFNGTDVKKIKIKQCLHYENAYTKRLFYYYYYF